MLRIPRGVLGPMVLGLGLLLPDEGCGLLLGQRAPGEAHRRGDHVVTLPAADVVRFELVANAAPNPRARFVLDRDEQRAVEDRARRWGMEVLAVVHSHPTAPAVPSAGDLAEPCVLDALIVSFGGTEIEARAWRWGAGVATEIEVRIQ